MALSSRQPLAALLAFLVAACVAGCLGPNTAVHSAEELLITITPDAHGRPYDLYLPVLLIGETPSPVFSKLDSASPDVSWTIVVHLNQTMLHVQGGGNATMAARVSLDGITNVAAYDWSSPARGANATVGGDVRVLLFGADTGGLNDTVGVRLHYAGNQSRPVAHMVDGVSRTCDLDAAVALNGNWQEFTVRDSLAVM